MNVMKRLVALMMAAIMFAGYLISCDGGAPVPPSGTTAGTESPYTQTPNTDAPGTEASTAKPADSAEPPETAPDETQTPDETDIPVDERQPNPGPSTLWGNNLDEPGKVRAPGKNDGSFQTGDSYVAFGSRIFYPYLGCIWVQDVNDPQPIGKLVWKDKSVGSGGVQLIVIDRAATEKNGGEPVLILFRDPIEGRGSILSVNTKTGEETIIKDGISGMLSVFTMYNDTLYYATFMMGDGISVYYTMYSVKTDGSEYTESNSFEASLLWSIDWIGGDRIYCTDGNVGHIVSYDLNFGDKREYKGLVNSVEYVDDKYIYYIAYDEESGMSSSLYRGKINDPSDARVMIEGIEVEGVEKVKMLGYYDRSLFYYDAGKDAIFEFDLLKRSSESVFEMKNRPDDLPLLTPVVTTDTYAVYIVIYRREDDSALSFGHLVCADYKTGSMWKIQY